MADGEPVVKEKEQEKEDKDCKSLTDACRPDNPEISEALIAFIASGDPARSWVRKESRLYLDWYIKSPIPIEGSVCRSVARALFENVPVLKEKKFWASEAAAAKYIALHSVSICVPSKKMIAILTLIDGRRLKEIDPKVLFGSLPAGVETGISIWKDPAITTAMLVSLQKSQRSKTELTTGKIAGMTALLAGLLAGGTYLYNRYQGSKKEAEEKKKRIEYDPNSQTLPFLTTSFSTSSYGQAGSPRLRAHAEAAQEFARKFLACGSGDRACELAASHVLRANSGTIFDPSLYQEGKDVPGFMDAQTKLTIMVLFLARVIGKGQLTRTIQQAMAFWEVANTRPDLVGYLRDASIRSGAGPISSPSSSFSDGEGAEELQEEEEVKKEKKEKKRRPKGKVRS